MADEIDFEFDTATFDELRETLEKVAKKYPDYAEKELKKEGKTIVCVTHDEEMAKSADRIIDLKKERGREKWKVFYWQQWM